MPTGFKPKRPSGTGPEARFMQWVYDTLESMRMIDTPGASTERTSKGFRVIPKRVAGGGKTGGLVYRGTYSSTESYVVNDIVRVQSGASQGVFICVRDNPANPTSIAPVFPEPVAPALVYWEMWAFGAKQINVCAGTVTKTVYLQATDSF